MGTAGLVCQNIDLKQNITTSETPVRHECVGQGFSCNGGKLDGELGHNENYTCEKRKADVGNG